MILTMTCGTNIAGKLADLAVRNHPTFHPTVSSTSQILIVCRIVELTSSHFSFRSRSSLSTWRRPMELLGSSRRELSSWSASTLRSSHAWKRPSRSTNRPRETSASRSLRSSASATSSTRLGSRRTLSVARTRNLVVSSLNFRFHTD